MPPEIKIFNIDLETDLVNLLIHVDDGANVTVCSPVEMSGDPTESQMRKAGKKAVKAALQAALDAL